jgi:spore coat polysaccharide biosynthesis protein SpsF
VAIIQARMGSSRLPGKVLADIEGRPVLGHMLGRLARAERLDEVAVATTYLPEDDAVAEFCRVHETRCVRGHPTDVLDRYHQAAEETGAGVIIRLTGDCPLIDPQVVDLCLRTYLEAEPPVDLVVNRLPGSPTDRPRHRGLRPGGVGYRLERGQGAASARTRGAVLV